MQTAVIRFPGTNREKDVIMALQRATGRAPRVIWHKDANLPNVDLIVLPGGFSYGDHLRAGAMAAHSPVMKEVLRQAERGVALLGICNGFQILTEAGLLPGALLRNAGLKFVCRDVHLRIESTDNPFTSGYRKDQVIQVPVAHHDGCYYADDEEIKRLRDDDRIAFRYCSAQGGQSERSNPNGSRDDIAGILSASRRILGLMPHPENAIERLQGSIDGCALFEGLNRTLN